MNAEFKEKNEILSWADLNVRYPMDREDMSESQQIEFLEHCYKLYEREGFAKKFWCNSSDFEGRIGETFKVVRRIWQEDADLDSLPMWEIQFEDGSTTVAWADEIIPSEMKANGCNIKDYFDRKDDNK